MSQITKYFDFWGSIWTPFLNYFNDWMIYLNLKEGYKTPDLFEHLSCPKDPHFSKLMDLGVEMGFQSNAMANVTLSSSEKFAMEYSSFVTGLPENDKFSDPLEKLSKSSLRDAKREISKLVHPDKASTLDKEAAQKVSALKNELYDKILGEIENAGWFGNTKVTQTKKTKELLALSRLAGEIWPLVCKDVKEEVDASRKNSWTFSTLEKPLSDTSKEEIIRFLLKKGNLIDGKNPEGKTLLMLAIERNESESLIDFLLNQKPNLDELDRNYETAFFKALKNKVGKKLLEKLKTDKSIDKASAERTPFDLAISNGNVEIAKWLLRQGADPKRLVQQKNHPFVQFIENPNLLDNTLLQSLLEKGVDPRSAEYHLGRSMLSTALDKEFSLKSILALIDKGANPNGEDENGVPVIWKAVNSPAFEKTVIPLIDKGASFERNLNQGQFLEFVAGKAMEKGVKESVWVEILKKLIDKGASVRQVFESGDNLLHVALKLELPDDFVCSVIELGADVNLKGSDGNYPFLQFILKNGFENSPVLDAFLKKDVDVSLSFNGKAVIDLIMDELEKSSEKESPSLLQSVQGYFSKAETSLEKLKGFLEKMEKSVKSGKDYGRLIFKSVEFSLKHEFIKNLVAANKNINFVDKKGKSIPQLLLEKKMPEKIIEQSLIGFDLNQDDKFGLTFLKTLLTILSESNLAYSSDFAQKVIGFSGLEAVGDSDKIDIFKLSLKTELPDSFFLQFSKSLPINANLGGDDVFKGFSKEKKRKWLKVVAETYFENKTSWGYSKNPLSQNQLKNFKMLMKKLLGSGAPSNIELKDKKLLSDLLLERGLSSFLPDSYWQAQPNWSAADENGDTFLLKSIKNDASEDFIVKLIELGADVHVQDKDKHSAFSWVISKGYSDKVIQKFEEKGAVFGLEEAVIYYRESLIWVFGAFCSAAMLHSWLTNKNDGWKPIHYAAKYNDAENLKNLLAKGNPINALTKSGDTPLAIAIKNNNIDAIRFLISESAIADVNKIDENGPHKGWKLMDFARYYKNSNSVQYLIKIGDKSLLPQKESPTKNILKAFQLSKTKNPLREVEEVERIEAPIFNSKEQIVLAR